MSVQTAAQLAAIRAALSEAELEQLRRFKGQYVLRVDTGITAMMAKRVDFLRWLVATGRLVPVVLATVLVLTGAVGSVQASTLDEPTVYGTCAGYVGRPKPLLVLERPVSLLGVESRALASQPGLANPASVPESGPGWMECDLVAGVRDERG